MRRGRRFEAVRSNEMPFLIRFLVFVAISLFIGLGSAAYILNHGFFATAKQVGPWSIWFHSGVQDADPYTLARVARAGSLPVTAASLLSFSALQDSDGNTLNGDCTYNLIGRPFPALWWNIAAFSHTGRPIENPANRHSFNSGNLLISGDGQFVVRVSPQVQPGNWLPVKEGERFVLIINILRPLNRDRILNTQFGADLMPRIVRVSC